MNISSAVISNDDLNELLTKYTPLVRATAYRYVGRGAEYEDLVQEGYLALIILIGRCADWEWMPAYLKNRMPGYVRAAASKMRGGRGKSPFVDIEDIEDIIQEMDSPYKRSAFELRDMLERVLTQSELDMTQSLFEGFTQKEIAEALGITQQAVSARLRQIKLKLEPLVDIQKK